MMGVGLDELCKVREQEEQGRLGAGELDFLLRRGTELRWVPS